MRVELFEETVRRIKALEQGVPLAPEHKRRLLRSASMQSVGYQRLMEQAGLTAQEIYDRAGTVICKGLFRHAAISVTYDTPRANGRCLSNATCVRCGTVIHQYVDRLNPYLHIGSPWYTYNHDYDIRDKNGKKLAGSEFRAAVQYLYLLREIEALERMQREKKTIDPQKRLNLEELFQTI